MHATHRDPRLILIAALVALLLALMLAAARRLADIDLGLGGADAARAPDAPPVSAPATHPKATTSRWPDRLLLTPPLERLRAPAGASAGAS